jgi:hypothetical protein
MVYTSGSCKLDGCGGEQWFVVSGVSEHLYLRCHVCSLAWPATATTPEREEDPVALSDYRYATLADITAAALIHRITGVLATGGGPPIIDML